MCLSEIDNIYRDIYGDVYIYNDPCSIRVRHTIMVNVERVPRQLLYWQSIDATNVLRRV